MTRPLRYLLHQAGLELRARGEPDEAAPTLRLADPCDAIYQHGDVAFELPLERAMYPYLFSYGPQGWHPFVAVLEQYRENRGLSYRDSILCRYYERFHPNNIFDVFFDEAPLPARERSPLAALAIPPHNPIFPWDPEPSHIFGEGGLDASHGNQGFGPVTEAKGTLEFRRLTEILTSIEARGYQPGNGHDGDIRGYFLRAENDYRFIVRQGLHRAAALAALGYPSLRVRFYLPYPRAIFEHDLANWPQVKKGAIDPGTARAIFRRFFEENGRARARRLGLLEPGR